jgi:hypothetical protein
LHSLAGFIKPVAMNQAHIPQRLPETMSAKDIGVHMGKLRAQFNLTLQEVSERLHIRTRYVSAIEEARYELMPGKVYARGYVHTYAEFLGLDANQVVAQCFANELPANAQPLPASPSRTDAARATSFAQWRSYGVMGIVALVLLLLVVQMGGRANDSEEPVANVAPVPEAMLASVRNLVMPTPDNYDCLMDDALLDCFFADNVTRTMTRLEGDTHLPFGGDIDVASMVIAPADADEEPVAEEMPAEATSTADE